MPRRFENSTADQANFSDCLLRLQTLPIGMVRKMREKRGNIVPDLGIKTVAIYTLCSTVLGTVAHVPSLAGRSDALRKMDIMVLGSITKKRRPNKRGRGRLETRDRTISYVIKFMLAYLAGDFETAFREEYSCTDLHGDLCKGDDLVADILSVMDDCPSFHHILPISLLSLIWLFVELMLVGTISCVPDIDVKHILECDSFHLYGALEYVSTVALKPMHHCVGALVGGDGRPSLPAVSVYGRDGEILKIRVSNTTLTKLMVLGSKMRTIPCSASIHENQRAAQLSVDTFFPLLLDAMAHKHCDNSAFESLMQSGEDLLKSNPEGGLVLPNDVMGFFRCYDTLLKCNNVSNLSWKGEGVLHRSKHVPDVVRCRVLCDANAGVTLTSDLSPELESDLRACRARLDSCMDFPHDFVRKDGKKVQRLFFGDSMEVCRFLHNCLKLAWSITRRSREISGRGQRVSDLLDRMRKGLFRELTFGLFACDLSGHITLLYEEYIYSSLMRHFDEHEGAPSNLRKAGHRRCAVRGNKKTCSSDGDDVATDDCTGKGRNMDDDEDWGPQSGL